MVSGLLDRILQRARDLSVPIDVHLDVTHGCNERCVHCYLEHGRAGEMTTAAIQGILDELARMGTLFLTISGGEPFLRQDLREIIEHARAKRFCVRLKTNGTLIGAEEAAWIRALKVEEVQVSIYSHSEDTHDSITGMKGSLAKSLNAIRLMRERGQKVRLQHPIMRQNSEDREAVYELAQSLGASFQFDAAVSPKLNGDAAVLSLNVPMAKLVRILRLPDASACDLRPPSQDGDPDRDSCGAARYHCYISPTGDVFPCVGLPLLCGNALREGMRTIWEGSAPLAQVRAIRVGDLPECSGCSHLDICPRCHGNAYLEGDLYGPSSLECRSALALTGVMPNGATGLKATGSRVEVGEGDLAATNAWCGETHRGNDA